MRPAEVIVLYVEVLFACSTLIIKCNDVFLGRHPVVGKYTAVCVYYSEHIRLLLAFLVFQSTWLPTFISLILRIIRKSKVFNFCAVLKLYDLSEVSLL